MGLPERDARGLPGNRLEAYRAGMIPRALGLTSVRPLVRTSLVMVPDAPKRVKAAATLTVHGIGGILRGVAKIRLTFSKSYA